MYSLIPTNCDIAHDDLDITDSPDPKNYDSDRIDSDIEEMLYSSIHHQTIDSKELSFANQTPKENDCAGSDELSLPKIGSIHNYRKIAKESKLKFKRAKRIKSNRSLNDDNGDKQNVVTHNKKRKTANKFDITYGNKIELNNNETDYFKGSGNFYMEDNSENEDVEKAIAKMPKSKRYWKICQEDRDKSRRRFNKKCDRCFSLTHAIKSCPETKNVCHICGENGHQKKTCIKNLICTNCFSSGHKAKDCIAKTKCNICHVIGHTDDKCTFHWRKFLTITTEKDYEAMANTNTTFPQKNTITINDRVSCYNCGKNTHFGHECRSLTINRKRFEIPSPIFNYTPKKDKPPTFKKVKTVIQNGKNETGVDGTESENSMDYVLNLLEQSTSKKKRKKRKKGKAKQVQVKPSKKKMKRKSGKIKT